MTESLKCTIDIKRVVDGDTFKGDFTIPVVDITFNNRKFRLLGVNTPERDESGYQEATDFTAKEIEGKTLPADLTGKDNFGRWLCKVYLGEKTLNVMLLENNLAEVYTKRKG